MNSKYNTKGLKSKFKQTDINNFKQPIIINNLLFFITFVLENLYAEND